MPFDTNIDLATTCILKGKSYEFYCHHCEMNLFNALTEREYINLQASLND